jgi:alanyl-tRNA synthetase
MALFGEKYADRVRVVSIPGFSMELCGGTHCRATGDIGFFAIVQEGGVAAGVRRIEALTGADAIRHCQERRATLDAALDALNVPAAQAGEAIQRLQAEVKRLAKEVTALRTRAAAGPDAAASGETLEIAGAKVVLRKVAGLEKAPLRDLADSLKARIESGVVVLASAGDGRVSIVVSVTKDLAGRVHAGQIVKEIAPIVGGGGGGRPDFAEAGGKDPARIDDLLQRSRALIAERLGAQP